MYNILLRRFVLLFSITTLSLVLALYFFNTTSKRAYGDVTPQTAPALMGVEHQVTKQGLKNKNVHPKSKRAYKKTSPKVLFVQKGFASTYASDPYTGFVDPADNNLPALKGASNNRPGIAVMNSNTLGGFWRITSPNGDSHVVQQTDLGPSTWTGVTFDINSVAARKLFRLPQGKLFPTKSGVWKGEYLGKSQR